MIAHDLASRNTAHGDLALARAEVLDSEARDVRRDVLEVRCATVAQYIFSGRYDGEGHLLQCFFSFTSGDRHLLAVGLFGIFGGFLVGLLGVGWCAEKGGNQREAGPVMSAHGGIS